MDPVMWKDVRELVENILFLSFIAYMLWLYKGDK